ncbi:unnamed protein product [Mytilus coruscus]|uniref:Ubiquitin-like protease family profile domain-containing protein n=1 Tax=Mytilus coruscus TaxID=42192 RepID=A0A6J8E156_MYTCO|nr:unnamed protein product [Mytilus coruscus]
MKPKCRLTFSRIKNAATTLSIRKDIFTWNLDDLFLSDVCKEINIECGNKSYKQILTLIKRRGKSNEKKPRIVKRPLRYNSTEFFINFRPRRVDSEIEHDDCFTNKLVGDKQTENDTCKKKYKQIIQSKISIEEVPICPVSFDPNSDDSKIEKSVGSSKNEPMYRTTFSDDTDIEIDSGSEWLLESSDRKMSFEESLSEDLPPLKRICTKRAKRNIINTESPVFRKTKLNARKYKVGKFSKTAPTRKNEGYDTSDEETEDSKEVEADNKSSSLHNRQCDSNDEEHEECSEGHNVGMPFEVHNIRKPMDLKTDSDEDNLKQCCEKEESDDSETQKNEEDIDNILNDGINKSFHSVDKIHTTPDMKSSLNDVHQIINDDNHSGSDDNRDISEEKTILFEKKKVKCSIVIPDSDWKKIKPSKPSYKLKTGWTDIFSRQLRAEMPSCSLTFKYQKVKKKNSRKKNCPYFKAQAKCKGVQCGTFDFVIADKPKKRRKEVAIEVIGHNIKHSNRKDRHKRHLMRSERTEVQKNLQSKGVSNVFYEKAASMQESELQFGNLSYCQSPTVLRKAKSEWNVHQNLHQDPFTELVLTKNILEDEDVCSKICKGYVQHIGFIPFLTILFTERQLMVLKHEVKHNSSVVYLDATGTVVERIKNQRVLYYAMVLPGPKGSPPLPVLEFLSDSQNTPTITYALMNFIHCWKKIAGKQMLSRVTVDFSWALIHSVLMSINNINIYVYLQWCFDVAYHGKLGQKYTVVHICCNHLLKSFRDRIASIKIDKTTKEYITRTFALLINCTDVPTAINLWKMLQVVFSASSPLNVVENSLPDLEACFVEGNTSLIKNEQEFICDVVWEEENNVNGIRRSSPFRHLFTLGSETDRNNENPYACDEVLRILSDDFMPLLPLWSGIMLGPIERHSGEKIMDDSVQSTTRESNAHVENWMKMVKCDTLQKDVRLRAGKFVRKLHMNLKGRIVAYQNNLHQFKPQKVVQNQEDFNDAEESWNKKGTPLAKRKSRYFSPITELKGTKPETTKQTKTKSKPPKMNAMTTTDQSKILPKHGISNRQQTCWIISTLQAIAASTIELKPENGNDVMECIVDIVQTLREPVSDLQIHDLNSLRERSVEEVLSILPVEIPGIDKPFISNCIDEFMKEEVLIDEDRSGQFCVGCSENTPHGRRYEFSKDNLPNNICVQVKRFVQNDNGPRKITKDIIVNRVIGIGDGKTLYRLAAIQIINYYLNLLENDRTKSLDVFFYSTLKKSKAIAVERLVKAEVMNFDMILVPINVSNHWILCTIDTITKTIQWYDSYLSLTSLATKHKKMDLIRDAVKEAGSPSEIQWKTIVLQHTPQQSNCSDCGVYLCHFAALLSVRQPVSFDSVSIHAVKNSNIYPFN